MPPIDAGIPLQAMGAPDNSGKLMQFAQLQQMGQQRNQQAQQLAAQQREHKRVKAMAERGTGLFMRYQTLKDNGFSEQAAHAAMQEDYQRDIGGLASLRDDNGQALFSQEELGQFGQEFNAGQLGQILPQLMGADKALDAYFKNREMKAEADDKAATRKHQADTLAVTERNNSANRAADARKMAETERHNRAQEAKSGKGGLTVDPETGQVSFAPGGPALKEGEGKSVTYGVRAASGLQKLEEIEDSGYDPANAMDRASESLPAGNFILSKSGQKYKQAASEFLGAILRKDTGAAITSEEMKIYGEMFFPQAGDSVEVKTQKREARRTAYDALKAGSGAGQSLIPNVPASAGAVPKGWKVTVKP